MDLEEFNEWLKGFWNPVYQGDKAEKLETMRALCEFFGHPESACPCFHVAGSKGKGTISASIAAILRSRGYKTGVFASPHVYHFAERVGTGEGPFSLEIYEKAEKELKTGIAAILKTNQIRKEAITWSILVTLFSMLVFREAKVDYAVYEVICGGRIDCTNVIKPVAIAVGPIELEHTKSLGDTLAKIATEKAGVFKENTPVFSAPQDEEAQAVFAEKAAEKHSTVTYIDKQHDYLLEDMLVAAGAVQSIISDLDTKVALEAAITVKIPGRYERIENLEGIPFVLLDGAHTVNSVSALISRLEDERITGNLIFACAADKNVEEIAYRIVKSGLFEKIYLTRPGDYKKSDLPRAEKAFKEAASKIYKSATIEASSDYQSLIKKAIAESAMTSMPLITFGSFYLLPEVKNHLFLKN